MNFHQRFAQFQELWNSLETNDDKTDYVIMLGKSLPIFDKGQYPVGCFVKGCLSQIYFECSFMDDKFEIVATSDSLIMRGVLSLIKELFNGLSSQEVLNADMDLIFHLEWLQLLSSQRSNTLSVLRDYLLKVASDQESENRHAVLS